MKKSLTILIALLLMVSAGCKPENQKDTGEATLRELADRAGLLIGVRAFLRDDAQKALVEKEFNTATRTCYPVSINPGPGRHDFSSFNEGVNWLHERGMKPMHHMICGPTQYESDWIKGITSAEILDSLLEERIRSIIQDNENGLKVNVWNVVNESLNWNDDFHGQYFMEDMVIWTRLGWEDDKSGLTGREKINHKHPVYIRKAFEYAAKYAKGKLELRDNGCEKPGRKARALYQLARHLQESGVKIDAVGLQCHYTLRGERSLKPKGLAAEIQKYRDMGLEVYLTEVDIARNDIPWADKTAQMQKAEYKKLITVALNAGVSQVHFWGLRDADEDWKGDENPLLFDENLSPKPAYYGVREALWEYLEKRKDL